MDPVTAFDLAAGILQMVDVSFKALSTCREIYIEGSSQDVREVSEIIRSLTSIDQRLHEMLDSVLNGSGQQNQIIIDVSSRCSQTAKELAEELEKLKIEPGSSGLKALRTGIRTIRKKRFLHDMESKLERYQRILDTEILEGLSAQTIH